MNFHRVVEPFTISALGDNSNGRRSTAASVWYNQIARKHLRSEVAFCRRCRLNKAYKNDVSRNSIHTFRSFAYVASACNELLGAITRVTALIWLWINGERGQLYGGDATWMRHWVESNWEGRRKMLRQKATNANALNGPNEKNVLVFNAFTINADVTLHLRRRSINYLFTYFPNVESDRIISSDKSLCVCVTSPSRSFWRLSGDVRTMNGKRV